MLTIVMRPDAAPQAEGGGDAYKNVTSVGGQNVNTGTPATDRTNWITASTSAVAAGNWAVVVYTDDQSVVRTVLLNLATAKAVIAS